MIPNGDWRGQAVCAETDPDLFFPERGQSTRVAKALCRSCAVRDECLDFAINHMGEYVAKGVWGGTSDADRERMRRDRIKAAARLAMVQGDAA